MTSQRFVTGDKELDRALEKIGGKIAEKAIASGVRAALNDMTKAMRREVRVATVKKTIAARFKRKKKFGRVEAKAGAGVGKEYLSVPTRGGVGISKNNAHWYFMGTATRRTHKGGNRGRMPIDSAIVIGASKSRATAMMKLRTKTRQVLEKEVTKLGRR